MSDDDHVNHDDHRVIDDHDQRPGVHDHSAITFRDINSRRLSDEAISRNLADYVRRNAKLQFAPGSSPTPPKTRRDEKTLTQSEKDLFNTTVAKLVADIGKENYFAFVAKHMDGSHVMHSPSGATHHTPPAYVGTYRFLPWHRAFLLRLEQRLQEFEPSITIPYWRWAEPFPTWLEHPELPAPAPPPTPPPNPIKKIARVVAPASEKPSSVKKIMEESHLQFPKASLGINNYVRFSFALEAGLKLNGTVIPAHNQMHEWIGGNMGWLGSSPADPIFWLLHAEVDRLWHIWQTKHPTMHPPLFGNDRMMTPFGLLYDELTSIQDLGYTYDDVATYS